MIRSCGTLLTVRDYQNTGGAMDDFTPEETRHVPVIEPTKAKWSQLLAWLAGFAGCVYWFNIENNAKTWVILGILIFSVCCLIMAIMTGISLKKKWTMDETENATQRVFTWVIGGVLLAIFCIWILADIDIAKIEASINATPGWAVIIIILLCIIISQLDEK